MSGSSDHRECRENDVAEPCSVRTFSESDAAIVDRLSREGTLPGQMGQDSQQTLSIAPAQLAPGREQFWVAEAGEQVIGTVALAEVSPDVACLRWLRVAPAWQAGGRVARRLVQTAATHARAMGFLKLVVEAPAAIQPQVVSYFGRLGFEFSGSREVGGTNLLEFYLNLYVRPQLLTD